MLNVISSVDIYNMGFSPTKFELNIVSLKMT